MKKLLIVDDQTDIRKLLGLVLLTDQRELLFARSGEECLELAGRHHPDLILLDIMMPGGIDGCETARELRRDDSLKDCIIIAMTAKVQKKDQKEVLDAGADECVVKPFDIRQLQKRIAEVLEG